MAIDSSDVEEIKSLARDEIERAVKPLFAMLEKQAAEIDRVDDSTNGVLVALLEVLLPLLRAHPDMAAILATTWRNIPERYERAQANAGQADDFHETAALLEPRKLLYRELSSLGVIPPPWLD